MRLALIVVACTVLMVCAATLLRSYPPQQPIQLTQDQDVLSGPNIVSYINALRVQRHLPALIIDDSLTKEAQDTGTNGDEFDTLTNGDYYSVQAYIASWNGKQGLYAGTRIGAWVTYYIPSQDAKPIPYVAILIR